MIISNNSVHYSKLKPKEIRIATKYSVPVQRIAKNMNENLILRILEEILIISIGEGQLSCRHFKYKIYTIEMID